jgi:hypothetical protein
MRSSTQLGGVMSILFLDYGITDVLTGAMRKYNGRINVRLELI